ncbi:MAG TPA: hypothetical protein VEJ63_08340 [Planctomycetota bacterium]|nr:hypothetical protein [Planctomycetota bacterium]
MLAAKKNRPDFAAYRRRGIMELMHSVELTLIAEREVALAPKYSSLAFFGALIFGGGLLFLNFLWVAYAIGSPLEIFYFAFALACVVVGFPLTLAHPVTLLDVRQRSIGICTYWHLVGVRTRRRYFSLEEFTSITLLHRYSDRWRKKMFFVSAERAGGELFDLAELSSLHAARKYAAAFSNMTNLNVVDHTLATTSNLLARDVLNLTDPDPNERPVVIDLSSRFRFNLGSLLAFVILVAIAAMVLVPQFQAKNPFASLNLMGALGVILCICHYLENRSRRLKS